MGTYRAAKSVRVSARGHREASTQRGEAAALPDMATCSRVVSRHLEGGLCGVSKAGRRGSQRPSLEAAFIASNVVATSSAPLSPSPIPMVIHCPFASVAAWRVVVVVGLPFLVYV